MQRTTIIVVLILALISTPCFAQEVETNGMFSIEGTRWQMLPIGLQIFPILWIWETSEYYFCFYGGEIYRGHELTDLIVFRETSYMDMLVFSIFSIPYQVTHRTSISYFGILQQNGIGMVVKSDTGPGPYYFNFISIALLNKTENNWTPPEDEPPKE